jgi:hypothetical protein
MDGCLTLREKALGSHLLEKLWTGPGWNYFLRLFGRELRAAESAFINVN